MLTAPIVGRAGHRARPLTTVTAIAAASLPFTAVLALSGCSKPAGAAKPVQGPLPPAHADFTLPSAAGGAAADPTGFDRVACVPSLERQVAEFVAEQWR